LSNRVCQSKIFRILIPEVNDGEPVEGVTEEAVVEEDIDMVSIF
jgi:hypothetical protein